MTTEVNEARFKINGTPSEDPATGNRGFVATNAQQLSITLEQNPSPVLAVSYDVYDPNDNTAPLSSKNAPNLVWQGSGTAKQVMADKQGTATITMPATGAHSYIIRCTVTRSTGSQTFERMVVIKKTSVTPNLYKTVPGETEQFATRGYSDLLNDVVDAIDSVVASAQSLDGGYNSFGSNPAIVHVDGAEGQGDLTWDIVGPLSFNIDLANTTGTADGFQVYDGSSEFWRVIRKNDANLDVEAAVHNIDYSVLGVSSYDVYGDVDWNLQGTTSFNVDLSNASGTVDGFRVANGSDAFEILYKGANLIDLAASLQYVDIEASQDIDWVVGTRSLKFEDQPYVAPNGGPGTPGGFKLSTAVDNLYFDVADSIFVDATNAIEMAAGNDSSFIVSGGDLLLGTSGSGNVLLNSAGNVGFNQSSFGAGAAGVLAIANGSAPGALSDAVQLWSADREATDGKAGLHLRSEDGTSHVFSDRVGIGTLTPSYDFSIASTDGTDQFGIYVNNDAYIRWTDGYLYLQSDEGPNANTIINIVGQGSGFGSFQVRDQDNEYLVAACYSNTGRIYTAGPLAGNLRFQYTGHADVTLFDNAPLGYTKELKIYGNKSGTLRSLDIGCDVDAENRASFDGLNEYAFDGILMANGDNAYSSAPASAISCGYKSSSDNGWIQVEGPATASPLNLQPDGSGVGIRGSWAAGGLHIYQSGWTWRTILEASSGQASIQFTGTGRASGDSYIIGRKNSDDTFAFAASYDLDTNRVFTINRSGLVALGSTDFSGTPATGRLIAKGSSNDGSTNVQVWRDSDENNVAVLDTDGRFALVASPLTNMAAGDLLVGGGSLVLPEITTPTADASFAKVYTKSDNKLYFQDGAGSEHELGFAGSAATFDQVYNTQSGTHTIDVNDGDVLWDIQNAYSFVVDIADITNSGDGFHVLNGTDSFKLLRNGANLIDLAASLQYIDIEASQDIDWIVGTRGLKFSDQPYVAPNGAPGEPGGFKIATTSHSLYINSSDILLIDAASDISISAGGNSNWVVDGGYVELKTTTSGDVILNPAGNVVISSDLTILAHDIITDSTTGTRIGTAATQKLGFYGVTPVVQPSAYTQTYSTANKTIGAYTADDESGAYTGIDNAQGGSVYAQVSDLNALRTAYETLRAFAEDIGQGLNSVIDDLQTLGLVA